ncbi:ABC transporter ATP-binding protein [Caldisericum exile]|uniref:Spermidine/putrescine import ATP-binding protein PotA n=1 Tax=Caldisericum exile (strain DSM 21853 / NBRC 104410 / AZM16c01) TaxID=511051 RepID=A0A7U6GFW4_CALEA|nr:polyamine ABC transporter ATP-binding protein [Caldisericum exile]BAL81567.1 ABC transporter ATP-binding protein [Caldisericum exile AZM16c01]
MGFVDLINVKKYYGRENPIPAVIDFNLSVEKGEFVTLLGPSGCGKTTTLRMIAGFETVTMGKILIDGVDVTYLPPNKRNVGMVFQSYALFPNMNVFENIAFGLRVKKKSETEIKKRVEEMLNLIHMQEFAMRYPHQLSGGQQQRVALARALAVYPEVLLLDEPLSALDAKIRVELRSEIRAIQQKLNITTIYVTHDQEEALTMSDRVVVMNKGMIEQVGTPQEIYNNPKTHFVASFVGTLNFINTKVVDKNKGILEVAGQKFDIGRPLSEFAHEIITVAIRPERFKIIPDENSTNSLEGTVSKVTFMGAIVRIKVKLGDSVVSCDTFNNPSLELPEIGDKIKIYFSKEDLLILSA